MGAILSTNLGQAVFVGLAVAVAVAAVAVVAVVCIMGVGPVLLGTAVITVKAVVITALACAVAGAIAGACYGKFHSGTTGGTTTGSDMVAETPPEPSPPDPVPASDDSEESKDVQGRRSRWILRFLPLEGEGPGGQARQCEIAVLTEGKTDQEPFVVEEQDDEIFYQTVERHMTDWLDKQQDQNKGGALEVFLVKEHNPGKSGLQRINDFALAEKRERGIRLSIGRVSAASPKLLPQTP